MDDQTTDILEPPPKPDRRPPQLGLLRVFPVERETLNEAPRELFLEAPRASPRVIGRASLPKLSGPWWGKVSREHLTLSAPGGQLTVQRLSATNPVSIDGVEIAQGRAFELRRGAVVRAGAAVFVATFPPPRTPTHQPSVIGCSLVMDEVRRWIAQWGAEQDTVGLIGDSGTGKEVVATALHAVKGRGEYSGHNMAVLNEEFVRDDLFGHYPGAFAGANQERLGAFREVGQGTLMLDEFHRLSLTLQEQLLRALDPKLREVQPLGNGPVRRHEARVILGVTDDLDQLVADQRLDGHVRSRVVATKALPLLDDRNEDVLLLLDMDDALHGDPERGPFVAERLLLKRWSAGNVRELLNYRRRLESSKDPLAEALVDLAETRNEPRFVDHRTKRERAEDALAIHKKKTRAAKSLGITVRTLDRWLKGEE